MAREQARRAEPEGDPRDAAPLEGEVIGRDGQTYGGAAQALQTLTDADAGLAATLTRAEIDQQIATAKRYPRQITAVQQAITTLATLDHQTAQESIYVLPRGGKKITGPSVRFAEMVAQSWGNCRLASRVTNVGKTHIECTGIYHDLETNVAFAKAVTVRITKSNGQRYDDDMIGVASQAGISKALRNAILAGVPKGVWRRGFDQAQAVIAGTMETLGARRTAMLQKMREEFGATPEDVYLVLGVSGQADITLGHMVALAGIYTSLQTQEARWGDMVADAKPNAGAAKRQLANDPKPSEPKEPAKPAGPKPAAAKPTPAAAKPAEETKPADTKPDKEADTPPASEEQKPGDTTSDADRLAFAYNDGAEAHAQGSPRQAPDDLQEEDEADSWLEGWDAAAEKASQTDNEPDTGADSQQADDGASVFDAADDTTGSEEGEGETVDADLQTFRQSLMSVDGWDPVRIAVQSLTKTEYWKNADQDARNAAFGSAWQAAVAAGIDLPDHRKDPAAFRLWLEAETDPEVIEKAFFDLSSAAAYGKMPTPGRDDMVKAKKARQSKLRGGDQ